MHSIKFHILGMEAQLYETDKGKWCLHLGGYYHWNCPLGEAIARTEKLVKEITAYQITKQIKALKREAKKMS